MKDNIIAFPGVPEEPSDFKFTVMEMDELPNSDDMDKDTFYKLSYDGYVKEGLQYKPMCINEIVTEHLREGGKEDLELQMDVSKDEGVETLVPCGLEYLETISEEELREKHGLTLDGVHWSWPDVFAASNFTFIRQITFSKSGGVFCFYMGKD